MGNSPTSTAPESRIAIILVNYKGSSDTIECLQSLLKLEEPQGCSSLSTFLVENASPDDSFEALRTWLQSAGAVLPNESGDLEATFKHGAPAIQVTLLRASQNRGFAAGCNLGLARAYRDPSITHFWLLNNDTIVHSKAVAELLSCSRHSDERCICGSTLLYFHDPEIVQAAAGARYIPLIGRSTHIFKRKRLPEIQRLSWPKFHYIVGASMFFSRSVLKTVGYIPERYFLYVEENDWCTRARSLGISLEWARESYVYHKEGRSTDTEAGFQKLGDDAFYFVARNNLLYVWKYFRHFILSTMVYTMCEALLYSFKGDWGKMKVASRAIGDFWKQRNLEEKPLADVADTFSRRSP